MMAGRCLVFEPLAIKARQAFVNSHHEAALEALCELDKLVESRPESGTETSSKGCFSLEAWISAHQKTFLCQVVYSFSGSAIRGEAFFWKAVKVKATVK